jgi:hypothetical protein
MDAGARETENVLKKEQVEVKDQVTAIKERTAKIRHGKWLVHRCGVARRAATGRRACCEACLLEMQVWRRSLVNSRTPPNKSWISTSRRRREQSQSR